MKWEHRFSLTKTQRHQGSPFVPLCLCVRPFLLLILLLACSFATPTPRPTLAPIATQAPAITATATPSPIPTSTLRPRPTLTPSLPPPPPPQVHPTATAAPETIEVNVYVIIVDPDRNGKPLTQDPAFVDPHPLMEAFIRDMYAFSGGSVLHRIVHESVAKEFPVKLGGFTYTPETYWTCVTSDSTTAPEYCHRGVDYGAFVNTRYDPNYGSICEAMAQYDIDEVWEWEGGWLGFLEFRIIEPYTLCPELDREFTLMAFNYSRRVPEMLESHAHRTENVLLHKLGAQLWDQFDGQRQRYAQPYDLPPGPDAIHPEVDIENAHCGNVHFPPNAYLHYQYDRQKRVLSDCDQWLNYPNLNGVKKWVNCSEWECNNYGFLKWWLSHIPHNPGVSNGIYHNWWKYVYP